MVTKGLFVRLQAKPGKEEDIEVFLRDSLLIVRSEPDTVAWFAIRMGPSEFGIFDVFPDEDGRQAHLMGDVATALQARATELFAQLPDIQRFDILAAKLEPTGKLVGKSNGSEEIIPMQVGSELRIRNNGEIVISNPEVDLALDPKAADATLAYRFNRTRGEHILRLLDPVADYQHLASHRPDD
jgi:quinol monooxygenase YgiN